MYAQVEKPKENKSRAVANSVAQKKSNVKQCFGFVDNRPEVMVQRKLQEMASRKFTQSQPPLQKNEVRNQSINNVIPSKGLETNDSGATSSPIIQRRLQIVQSFVELFYRQNNRFRTQVITSINQLLNGSGVTATQNAGLVALQGQPNILNDPRFTLLNNVVNSNQTILVKRTQGGASTDINKTGNQQTDNQRLTNATNNTGTGAVVLFDPSHTDVVPTTQGPQQMPSWLILGHELIHGSRIQGGRAVINPNTGERQVGIYNNLSTNRPEIGHMEEMQTVGLNPYSQQQIQQALADQGALSNFRIAVEQNHMLLNNAQVGNEPVSENDLRTAHNLDLRAGYETFRQQVLVPRHQGNANLLRAFDTLGQGRRLNWAQISGIVALVGVPTTAFLIWYFRNR